MANITACLSHNSDDWRTPSWLYNDLMKKGYKDLFPYKASFNQFDVLFSYEKLFINPPFSKLDQVVNYVITLYQRHNQIALLMPVRTDTRYFHKLYTYCYKDMTIYFIKGRLKFNDSQFGAPFPCMLVLLGSGECSHGLCYCTEQEELLTYL